MQVILILDAESGGKRLASLSRKLGAPLKAMHPGTSDAGLRKYFTAEVGDAEAEEAAQRVRTEAGVEAAYTKPADFAPF